MLSWALVFYLLATIAALFGFTELAGAASGAAKVLFLVFIALFLVSLIVGLVRKPGRETLP